MHRMSVFVTCQAPNTRGSGRTRVCVPVCTRVSVRLRVCICARVCMVLRESGKARPRGREAKGERTE